MRKVLFIIFWVLVVGGVLVGFTHTSFTEYYKIQERYLENLKIERMQKEQRDIMDNFEPTAPGGGTLQEMEQQKLGWTVEPKPIWFSGTKARQVVYQVERELSVEGYDQRDSVDPRIPAPAVPFVPIVFDVKGPRHYEKEVKVKFQYLKVGKCYGLGSTLNADILLQQNLSEQEMINFVKYLTHDKDIVILNIFTSKAAYRDVYCETRHSETDYILSYIKNLTNRRHPKSGVNQISWMQKIGPFSGLPRVQL